MTSKLPIFLSDAIDLYVQSEPDSTKVIRNLRTMLKLSVLPSFGFSQKALMKLDTCLAKLTLREFIPSVWLFFELFYQQASSEQTKTEATLRNYRSCLKRFHEWMESQPWYQEAVQITPIPERAPRIKSPSNLQKAHRGRRKCGEYPYSLVSAELTPALQQQVESLKTFWTAEYVPARRGETALRPRSWRCRQDHLFYFLGWLHHDTSSTYQHRSCPIDGSKRKLDELDIRLMCDREVLENYLTWQISEKGNGAGHAVQIGAIALTIAKWNFAVNEKAPKLKSFSDCQAVLEIRGVMKELKPQARKDRRTTSRDALDEKLLTLEQCQELVEYLRRCCAVRTHQGHRRSDTRIIDSWQDYLICAIFTYTPVRQREIREMEIGKTLRREADGWWVRLSPDDHKTGSKTGKGREYPLFPCHLKERLTHDLDTYIRDWRSQENLDHNYLFFLRGTDAQNRQGRGQPIVQENHLSRLIPKLVFKMTGILYGPENAKATTPHDFRRIFTTWLFKYGTPEDIEIYTEILGHSPEEARQTYQQVTSREKTERAQSVFRQVSKRAEEIEAQKIKPTYPSKAKLDLNKIISILTPEQKRQLGL